MGIRFRKMFTGQRKLSTGYGSWILEQRDPSPIVAMTDQVWPEPLGCPGSALQTLQLYLPVDWSEVTGPPY